MRGMSVCEARGHSQQRTQEVPICQETLAGAVCIDVVGPFRPIKIGNTTILVLLNHFTRWEDAMALPNGTAKVVAVGLEHWVFCDLSVPERIHTDQSTQFESAPFKQLCELC